MVNTLALPHGAEETADIDFYQSICSHRFVDTHGYEARTRAHPLQDR